MEVICFYTDKTYDSIPCLRGHERDTPVPEPENEGAFIIIESYIGLVKTPLRLEICSNRECFDHLFSEARVSYQPDTAECIEFHCQLCFISVKRLFRSKEVIERKASPYLVVVDER